MAQTQNPEELSQQDKELSLQAQDKIQEYKTIYTNLENYYQQAQAKGDTKQAAIIKERMDWAHDQANMVRASEGQQADEYGNYLYSTNKSPDKKVEGDSGSYISGTGSNLTGMYQDAQKNAENSLLNMKQSQIKSVDDNYNDLEKEAYITKMQSEGSLPALLAATGKTGGLAETTAAAPTVAYQNALTGYGKERAKAINDINLANDQQALQIAIDFADKIINQANIDRSYNYSVNSDQWNRNFQQAQFNYNNSWNEKQYKDSQSYQAQSLALQRANITGSFQIMSAYGWTPEEIQAAEAEWKRGRGL